MSDFVFTPLDASPRDFPRVSPAAQAERDAEAERLVAAEFDQDMPAESRAALESEYQQRFGKPAPDWKFTPLDGGEADAGSEFKFTPIEPEQPDGPSFAQRAAIAAEPFVVPAAKTMQAIASGYPAAETAGHLATMGVALPLSGIAGLATEAARAVGLTKKRGADVVKAVGDALVYQPKTALGQHLTASAMVPFEMLAEAGQWAGGKVLDATGSPAAATAVDTTIQAIPMAIAPGLRGARAVRERMTSPKAEAPRLEPRGFIPLTDADAMPAAIAARGAAETGRGIPEPTRSAENAAAVDLASPEARGFISPVQAVAEAAISDLRQRGARALEEANGKTRAERLAGDDPALHGSAAEGLVEIRRSGDPGVPGVAGEFSDLPLRHGPGADAMALAGAAGRARALRDGELLLDDAGGAAAAPRILPEGDSLRPGHDGGRGGASAGATEAGYRFTPLDERFSPGESAGREALSAVDVAELQRRNAAAAGMGAADRPAVRGAVAEGEARHAAGAGADTGTLPQPKTARWALVEADDLKPSHDANLRPTPDYPENLVRPDWARADAEGRVQDINHRFDPNRLAEALDDADGAPIVARDGIVEAGNARAVAIQRVYQANGLKANSYRQFLRDNAVDFGLSPEQIAGMKKPVLVRVPDEPAPRRAAAADFSAEAAPAVQSMAAGSKSAWAPGENYIPLRDTLPAAAEQATTPKATKPIRREDVLRPFLEALDINVYHGRVKGKRLGYYIPKKEIVRVKNKSDLEVTAHEIGHLLDDRVPAIRAAWRGDKELREQLRGISYDKNSIAEGYAEGVRLWLSNPEALEAAAPKVFGWLETFAETHPLGPALRQAQRGVVSWFEQSALDRGRSKIGDPTSLKNRPLLDYLQDHWKEFRKGLRQSLVDDLDGIRLAEMGLTGKLSPLGAYETARLTRAAASITDGAIRWGHPVRKAEGSFTYSGKGLEEVLRPVAGKLDDFITYSVGRSARELLQQGREHLLSPAEVKAMVALETPEFRSAFAELQTWQKGVTDFAESLGLLNPETRKLWRRQDYIPFYRVEQGISGRGDVSGAWSGIKALKGGSGNLREPLQNIIQNANMLIGAALKNDARLRVVEMIGKEQGGGKFMQKIPAESKQIKVDAQQVQDAVLKGLGIEDRASLSAEGAKFAEHVGKQIAEAPEFYQFFVGGQAPKGNNIVAVMKAGKPEYYEVADPLLLRAMTAIDRPAQSWIIKLLGAPKRLGQASITLDPSFMAANYFRDQMTAGIMTKSGFRPLIDAMDGMRRRVTSDPLYREWVANGGGMSSLFLDESTFRSKLEQFYTRQGIDYRTVIDSPKKLLSMIETFGDAVESATRIGSFKRSLEKGDHPRHAAYEAREVSVDFSMAGDAPAVRALYDSIIFLRATVVSWDRLYRGVVHDSNRGAIAAKTAMLGLASAALYLKNRGDPRYDDMSDFLKDSHFHVFLGDHHFMIPRPFEPGAIGRIAEVAVEKVMNADPEGLGKDLARIIGNTFHLNLMPQIAAPLVEQYANKNSFTGAPIETPDHANVQPFLRSKPGTSETMKTAGFATRDMPESMQINPARAEALLRGYLNSWANYSLLASDRLVVGKNLPEMRADELPVVRRFYQSEPPKHTKFETEFYQFLSEAKRLRGTLRELDDMNLRGLADEKEKSPMTGEAKPLERAAKNLGAINNDMQSVRRDPNLTPAEKRQKLDALTVERNVLLKEAVLASRKAQKEKTP